MKNRITFQILLMFSLWLGIGAYSKEKHDDGRERYSWTLGYAPDQVIEFYRPEPKVDLKLDVFLPADHSVDDKRPCILFFA